MSVYGKLRIRCRLFDPPLPPPSVWSDELRLVLSTTWGIVVLGVAMDCLAKTVASRANPSRPGGVVKR